VNAVSATEIPTMLVNPTNPRTELFIQQMQEPARLLGLRLQVLKASTDLELESAFSNLEQLGVGAVVVSNEPSYDPKKIAMLAMRHAIPSIYGSREYAADGGLMTYDSSILDTFRQVDVYVGHILKGERPADLPVMQPVKFELVVNLKAAKAIGLTIPETFLVRADEVIE
jgi:putative ABC transport system substrate-binding protein